MEGVQARAFLGLELEDFQYAHGLAGGGDEAEVPSRRSEHHPGGRRAEQALSLIHIFAEGVETIGQMDYCRLEQVEQVQGFLFARPLEPELLEAQLLAPTRSRGTKSGQVLCNTKVPGPPPTGRPGPTGLSL